MDLADDISFGVHDLEDAVALRLLSQDEFVQHVPESACASFLDYLKSRYPDETDNNVYEVVVRRIFGSSNERKHTISRMVGHLMAACEIAESDGFSEPLLRYRAHLPDNARRFLDALGDANREAVIQSPVVQQLEFKGQNLVIEVFEALESEPLALLPRTTQELYRRSDGPTRVICDHVSGMTDDFLITTHHRLFSPGAGSVFDRL